MTGSGIRVVLFSRPGCHLCDSADGVIRGVRKALGFDFDTVNIEIDPELERRYGTLIPVVEIDGDAVFRYRVDARELEREVRRRWNG